jgi:hypothetical protein
MQGAQVQQHLSVVQLRHVFRKLYGTWRMHWLPTETAYGQKHGKPVSLGLLNFTMVMGSKMCRTNRKNLEPIMAARERTRPRPIRPLVRDMIAPETFEVCCPSCVLHITILALFAFTTPVFFFFNAAAETSCKRVVALVNLVAKMASNPGFVKASASCHRVGTHFIAVLFSSR